MHGMSAPRLFVDQLDSTEILLPPEELLHAAGPLRLRDGEPVEAFDGRGGVAHGTLRVQGAGKRRTGHVDVEKLCSVPPLSRPLAIVTAACKGPRLTWLVEKCVELGVARLQFHAFERSVVQLSPANVGKLRRTAIEACKQCRRAWLPELAVSANQAPPFDTPAFVAHREPAVLRWRDRAAGLEAATIFVGPEGGFSQRELQQWRSQGFECVSLGEHVLRIETACVSAAAQW